MKARVEAATRDDGGGFLRLLAAMLIADRGTPGFAARLGIGVRSGTQEQWLHVILADHADVSLHTTRPEDADATLLMGAAEAQRLLESGRLPDEPELLVASGDRQCLGAFFARYQPKSAASIR
jgi:hypothetical protein